MVDGRKAADELTDAVRAARTATRQKMTAPSGTDLNRTVLPLLSKRLVPVNHRTIIEGLARIGETLLV
ncbi:hypothetical protein MPLA_80023 [Mesorhizobium sp. ORS 3359]|nr:hypothetical protein MPLA_80023 [Mesorhizobium sp. ORS 3359]